MTLRYILLRQGSVGHSGRTGGGFYLFFFLPRTLSVLVFKNVSNGSGRAGGKISRLIWWGV